MDSSRLRSIWKILQSRINTPLTWGVILMTLALTVLFYFSQKQQLDVYGKYINALSDYKFFEARVMQKMEKSQVFPERDSTGVPSSLRGLRETAVSLYASSEKDRAIYWMPPEQDFADFENAVLRWGASIKRYVPSRALWLDSAAALSREIRLAKIPDGERLLSAIDSARMGFAVAADESYLKEIPLETAGRIRNLLVENENLAAQWDYIDNDASLMAAENLLQAFKMQSLKSREVKFWIQQIFYLTSIVLLLFTLFFVIRSRK